MTNRIGRYLQPAWTLLALFWIGCIALQFPRSFTDDLYFIGPAISLVQGHGISNPFEVRIFPGMVHFFPFPPLQYYATAPFILLLGNKAVVWQICWASWQFAGSLALTQILRRLDIGRAAFVLAPVLLLGINGWEGMRPEIIAIPLVLLGVAILLVPGRSMQRFVGFFALFLGAAMAPSLAVAAVGTTLWFVTRAPAREWRRDALLVVAAGLTVLGLLLLAIGFEVTQFLHQMQLNAAVSKSFTRGRLTWEVMWCLLHLLLLAALYGAVCYRQRSVLHGDLFRTAVGIGVVVLVTLAFYVRTPVLELLLSSAYLALLMDGCRVWQVPRRGAVLALAGVLAAGNLFLGAGNFRYIPGPAARQRMLADTHGRSLVVDPEVARYVYDFAPPSGTTDSSFQVPVWRSRRPRQLSVRQSEVLLISEYMLLRHYSDALVPADNRRGLARRAASVWKFLLYPFIGIEAYAPGMNAAGLLKGPIRYCRFEGPIPPASAEVLRRLVAQYCVS